MENLTDFTEIGRIVLENIKKTRQEKGLTEETAALKSGIDREQLEKLESGNLTFLPPPYVIALLRKYALALGIYDETLFKQLKESADIPVPKSHRKRTAQSQKSADRTENKNRNLYASITTIIVIAAAALWMIFGRPIQQPPPMEHPCPMYRNCQPHILHLLHHRRPPLRLLPNRKRPPPPLLLNPKKPL